jgi:hypothetical protein
VLELRRSSLLDLSTNLKGTLAPLCLSLNSAVIIASNLYITDSLNLKNSMGLILLPLRRYRVGLEAAKKELSESIQKGIAFVNK